MDKTTCLMVLEEAMEDCLSNKEDERVMASVAGYKYGICSTRELSDEDILTHIKITHTLNDSQLKEYDDLLKKLNGLAEKYIQM